MWKREAENHPKKAGRVHFRLFKGYFSGGKKVKCTLKAINMHSQGEKRNLQKMTFFIAAGVLGDKKVPLGEEKKIFFPSFSCEFERDKNVDRINASKWTNSCENVINIAENFGVFHEFCEGELVKTFFFFFAITSKTFLECPPPPYKCGKKLSFSGRQRRHSKLDIRAIKQQPSIRVHCADLKFLRKVFISSFFLSAAPLLLFVKIRHRPWNFSAATQEQQRRLHGRKV